MSTVTGVANATVIDTFDTMNPGWTVDRSNPATWEIANFDGDNRLKHGVKNDPNANTWYGYQGKSLLTPGLTSVVVDLYVPTPERLVTGAPQEVSFSLWANGTDGINDQLAWPVLGFRGFANGTTAWRIFDDEGGSWVALAGQTANYNTWYNLGIAYTGSSIVYTINGATVYTDTVVDPSITGFKNVILQAYNFGTDQGYSGYWDNLGEPSVPGPAAAISMGLGLLGVRLRSRRTR